MPKIAEIERTPNPNAMKFVLREPLTYGIARSYDSADQAIADPLAAALFDVPHVTNVYYSDRWLTVTQDGQAEWQELLRQLADPIRSASAETINQELFETKGEPFNMSPEDMDRLEVIEQLLDDQIRPFLQGDGGDLQVLALEGNRLKIHYQGACGSCPSSLSGTLVGIENLLRQVEPDIEVIAI